MEEKNGGSRSFYGTARRTVRLRGLEEILRRIKKIPVKMTEGFQHGERGTV